jgi:hypothetical protein
MSHVNIRLKVHSSPVLVHTDRALHYLCCLPPAGAALKLAASLSDQPSAPPPAPPPRFFSMASSSSSWAAHRRHRRHCLVDSYLQRGVVCAAASPRAPPFNDCPHCRRSARSTGGSRGGCLSLLLAMLTGRSTPADRARRLSQTTLSLLSYLIVDRRDKIRLLGFTTLHDSRRYAIPRCLDPSHPDIYYLSYLIVSRAGAFSSPPVAQT